MSLSPSQSKTICRAAILAKMVHPVFYYNYRLSTLFLSNSGLALPHGIIIVDFHVQVCYVYIYVNSREQDLCVGIAQWQSIGPLCVCLALVLQLSSNQTQCPVPLCLSVSHWWDKQLCLHVYTNKYISKNSKHSLIK